MKALALIEPKRVALIEAPEPAGEGSLVSLEASSVNIGDIRGMRDERRSVSHGKAMVYPRLLGFTGVGRMIEPDGSARSRGIMRGQRVVIGGVWGCGTCRWCKAALPNLCDTVHLAGIDDETSGRWRERLRVPGDLLFRIDEAVDYRVAAIVSEIATVNRCVKRSRLEAGDIPRPSSASAPTACSPCRCCAIMAPPRCTGSIHCPRSGRPRWIWPPHPCTIRRIISPSWSAIPTRRPNASSR
jgi:D-arabinose 1-dehydrogenase-like Zn-dependent alcohol dehydrogenase